MRLFALIVILFFTCSTTYAEIWKAPMREIPNNSLNDIAITLFDQYGPVIYFNPFKFEKEADKYAKLVSKDDDDDYDDYGGGTVECNYCQGRGELPCRPCFGRGTLRCVYGPCPGCGFSGTLICGQCGGTGTIECKKCNGTGTAPGTDKAPRKGSRRKR